MINTVHLSLSHLPDIWLQVLFEDMIGEPDGAHSADVIWTWAFKCFTGERLAFLS